jgi:hypothetical protein
MVFNATFTNISFILWRSVLLVKETGAPCENHFFPLVDGSSFVVIVEKLRVIRSVIFVLNVAFYS